MNRFQGKTVVVTGSARGQGAAEIRRFHSEGANVVVCDVLAEVGQTLAASLGERALYVEHDVSSEPSWQSLFATVESHFGGVDVLVNNAVSIGQRPFSKPLLTLWRKCFASTNSARCSA